MQTNYMRVFSCTSKVWVFWAEAICLQQVSSKSDRKKGQRSGAEDCHSGRTTWGRGDHRVCILVKQDVWCTDLIHGGHIDGLECCSGACLVSWLCFFSGEWLCNRHLEAERACGELGVSNVHDSGWWFTSITFIISLSCAVVLQNANKNTFFG